MRVDIGFPLTLEHIQSASSADLTTALRSWIARDNPPCLLHPHGFLVVLLHRSDKQDWRFHFWPKGPRKITGMPAMIHTHDKIIESRIIQGRLTNILYDVTDVDTGGNPIYEVGYYGDKYAKATSNVLQKTGTRAQANSNYEETLQSGACYRIEGHVYHEAIVGENMETATIVCMHSQSPGAVKVLGLDGYPDKIEFYRSERSAQEFIYLA